MLSKNYMNNTKINKAIKNPNGNSKVKLIYN